MDQSKLNYTKMLIVADNGFLFAKSIKSAIISRKTHVIRFLIQLYRAFLPFVLNQDMGVYLLY